MKRPLVVAVLVLSLFGNLALAAVLFLRSDGDAPLGDVAGASVASGTTTSASPQSGPTSGAAKRDSVEAVHASSGVRPDTWSKLGSSNLPTLVANLRAAGFPDRLVRSIIGSMISEQFADRRRALRGNQEDTPYWKTGNRMLTDISKQADLRALSREQSDLMKSVLGEEFPSEEMRQMQRRQFGPLPSDKLDLVARINSDYNELSMQTQAEINGVMLPWDREQLAMIEKEKRADLAATLTPEELQIFDLYSSQTANSLRSRLAQFNPSEQEFRNLYELQRAFDDKYNPRYGMVGMDQAAMQERPAAQRQLNEQIKNTLGEARYAEYERAQDNGYRTASRIVERLNLPPENAVAVYDLQKSVQQQAAQLRSDRNQTNEARAQAIAALTANANQRIVSLLGAQGAEAFAQSGGNVLRVIDRVGGPVGGQTVIRQGTTIITTRP